MVYTILKPLVISLILLISLSSQSFADFYVIPVAKNNVNLPQIFSMLAETMQPIDSSMTYDNTEVLLKTTSSGANQYIGHLSLPHGAKILKCVGFGRDTDSGRQFEFRIFRYNLTDSPVWTAVSNWVVSGVAYENGNIQLESEIIPSFAEIDNVNYSYGIFLVLPPAQVGKELGVLRFYVETTSN